MIVVKFLVISWLLFSLNDIISLIIETPNFFKLLRFVTICLKCLSFWVTLIGTGGDIIISGIVSFIAFLIDKYIL